jgi:hypothetical protein
MTKRNDLKREFARLPDGQKVRIESLEGDTATVRRVGGPRPQTWAVCRIDRLKPV